MSDFQVPDWIEAAVAWRVWKVEMLELRSVTVTHDAVWPPHKQKLAACSSRNAYVWTNVDEDDPRPCWLEYLKAQGIEQCAGGRAIEDYEKETGYVPKGKIRRLFTHEPAPCPNHTCGIYAVTDLNKLASYATYDRAIGTVSLWGKTTPGDSGYRAEYAYPKELWIPARAEDLEMRTRVAEHLSEQYGIPVHVGLSEEIMKGIRAYHGRPQIDSLIAA